jgi:hypothetical protein
MGSGVEEIQPDSISGIVFRFNGASRHTGPVGQKHAILPVRALWACIACYCPVLALACRSMCMFKYDAFVGFVAR